MLDNIPLIDLISGFKQKLLDNIMKRIQVIHLCSLLFRSAIFKFRAWQAYESNSVEFYLNITFNYRHCHKADLGPHWASEASVITLRATVLFTGLRDYKWLWWTVREEQRQTVPSVPERILNMSILWTLFLITAAVLNYKSTVSCTVYNEMRWSKDETWAQTVQGSRSINNCNLMAILHN